MNAKRAFFENIEKHCLASLRRGGLLSEEIDRCVENYEKVYNANPVEERKKLLFLICESFLHNENEKKLKAIVDKYCSFDNVKSVVQKRSTRDDNPFTLLFGDCTKQRELMLKATSNIFEFLLINEYGIKDEDIYSFPPGKSFKWKIFANIIELMRLYMEIYRREQSNVAIRRKRSKKRLKTEEQADVNSSSTVAKFTDGRDEDVSDLMKKFIEKGMRCLTGDEKVDAKTIIQYIEPLL